MGVRVVIGSLLVVGSEQGSEEEIRDCQWRPKRR
jgi:hypothetical protein